MPDCQDRVKKLKHVPLHTPQPIYLMDVTNDQTNQIRRKFEFAGNAGALTGHHTRTSPQTEDFTNPSPLQEVTEMMPLMLPDDVAGRHQTGSRDNQCPSADDGSRETANGGIFDRVRHRLIT